MAVNNVSLTPITNKAAVIDVKNTVEASVFSVTSAYYLLTQFQPYRHDTKVGADE